MSVDCKYIVAMNYREKIYLSRLMYAEVHSRYVNGEMVDCISIPIEMNGLKTARNGAIILELDMREKYKKLFNQTHYLSLVVKDPEKRQEIAKNGFKKQLTYLGNASQINLVRKGQKLPQRNMPRISLNEALNVEE